MISVNEYDFFKTFYYFFIIFINCNFVWLNMIELGNKNMIFRSKGSDSVVSEIINFLDLTGMNALFITSDVNSSLSMRIDINYIHCSSSNIETKLKDHLFRVEHLFVEVRGIHESNQYFDEIRKVTSIPITFILSESKSFRSSSNYHNIDNLDYDFIYLTKRKKSDSVAMLIRQTLKNYIVEDLKNNWESNLENLKISYIRNKKLEDLFGDLD